MTVTISFSFEEVLPEFQANFAAANAQGLSNVLGLTGGGYAFICASDGPAATDDEVQLAIYGTPNDSQPSFSRRAGVDVQGEPVVTQVSNGNVVFVWKEGPAGKSGIVTSIFDPSLGNIIVDQKEIRSVTTDTDPEVIALGSGGFAVVYTDTATGQVSYQRLSNDGDLFGSPILVASGATDPAIVTLNSGRVAVTYTRAGDVKAKVFEVNGTEVAGLGEITVGSGDAGSAQIAALKNGGFAIVYDDDRLDPSGVAMKLYDANGADRTASGPIRFDLLAGSQQQDPEITVLDNGFILVTYSDVIRAGDRDILGRLFDQDGNAIDVDGGEFAIDELSGQQTQSSVSVLSGTQFVTTWTDDDPGDGDGTRISGRVQELVRVQTGDGADDSILGNDQRDVIRGGGGGDLIFGLDGRDDQFGDAGNDRIVVQPGELVDGETFDGGADSDTLQVNGNVTDQYDFRQCTVAGFETLAFFNFSGAVTAFFTAAQFKQFRSIGLELSATSVVSIDMGEEIRLDLSGLTFQGSPSAVDRFVVDGDGNDETIIGSALADTIKGGAGADKLDGRGGRDVMTGGTGNDIFFVNDADDGVKEKTGEGTADRVLASVNYTLKAGQDIEILTTTSVPGTTALKLTGNEKSQTITGNDGANVLDGKGSTDTMRGFKGNDTYFVDNAGDTIIEAKGGGTADRVATSATYTLAKGQDIESLSTTAISGKAALKLIGNENGQTLTGNNGGNVLDGKEGADLLRGFGGKDSFLFSTKLGVGNVDRILDFSSADDTVRLENAIFKALAKTGTLSEAAFKDLGVAGARVDGDDRILYNSKTGAVSYDADGSGAKAAILFARIDKHPDLTFQDFLVV